MIGPAVLLNDFHPSYTDIDRDSYMYHNARREAFSRWLAAVSGEVIKNEVQENKHKVGKLTIIIMFILLTHSHRLAQDYCDTD